METCLLQDVGSIYIQCPLGLATYIGLSDLNRVDENWSVNPAGTVFTFLVPIAAGS